MKAFFRDLGISMVVKGRQTHGSAPWSGVDPIVVASQIVIGLQTIASRQIDVTSAPAVITIGMIQGGNRVLSGRGGAAGWRALDDEPRARLPRKRWAQGDEYSVGAAAAARSRLR